MILSVPKFDLNFEQRIFCDLNKNDAGKIKLSVNSKTSGLKAMNPEQHAFYCKLKESINDKTYLQVENQAAYLNYYIREKYQFFDRKNLELLYDELVCLSVPYGNTGDGIWWRPQFWSYDCLLALESYEKFLEITQPTNIFSTNTHFANLKCNVRYYLGLPASAIDLLQIYGGLQNSITNFTKHHPEAFKQILEAVFAEEGKLTGPWLERIFAESDQKDYQNHLFPCLHFARLSKIPNFCFYGASAGLTKQICDVIRKAENQLRQTFGEKNIGEQWDEETQLFYNIKKAFSNTEVVHHGKPEWLGKQHLDIWMPKFRIGIEYHGEQHFRPMRHLGGDEHLVTQKERDLRKSDLCKKNGVRLIIVTAETSNEEIIDKITEAIAGPLPFVETSSIKPTVIEPNIKLIAIPEKNCATMEDDSAGLWVSLVEAVGKVSPFTRSYLCNGHLVSFEDDIFTIGFSSEFEECISLIDNARTQKLIASKLSELRHPGMKVKFIKSVNDKK